MLGDLYVASVYCEKYAVAHLICKADERSRDATSDGIIRS